MDKRFYVINYKETVNDGVMTVECGSFDYGYESLEEAKNALIDIAQKKVEDFDEDDENVTETWSDDKEYVSIGFYEDTYEYYIYMITIPDYSNPPF